MGGAADFRNNGNAFFLCVRENTPDLRSGKKEFAGLTILPPSAGKTFRFLYRLPQSAALDADIFIVRKVKLQKRMFLSGQQADIFFDLLYRIIPSRAVQIDPVLRRRQSADRFREEPGKEQEGNPDDQYLFCV